MGERWRLLCSEGLGNRHIQEARASVGGQTSTQTSRGVSRDGGGGGGLAIAGSRRVESREKEAVRAEKEAAAAAGAAVRAV